MLLVFIVSSGCSSAYKPQAPFKESLHENVNASIPEATTQPSKPLNRISPSDQPTEVSKYDVVIVFPAVKYPETAKHIQDAIENGESNICTIDRSSADANRDKSLDGIPTKKGYDRDEWPMAMCSEGGSGADIAYVTPSDNRGAGSWVGNQLDGYKDGTRILFLIERDKSEMTSETLKPISPIIESTKSTDHIKEKAKEALSDIYYKNCTAVKEAGVAPIHVGEPGYSKSLDRDGDGVVCES